MLRLVLVALGLLFVGSIADVPAMFLAVRGMLPLPFIFIVGFLADVIPDFFWYWLGGKIGIERFGKLRFFRQNPARLEVLGRVFDKRGGLILFGSKFVYAFGIPSQIVAGAHRYDLKKMFLANSLGALGWLILLYYLAKAFSTISVIEKYIKDTKVAFLLFFAAAIALHFLLGRPLKSLLKKAR
jgi:membrane protein DedA with SNARE-associated domain